MYTLLDITGGCAMARTVIDLDDQLVADVSKALGTGTKKDTVNAALREVLDTRRRALALTRLQDAAADGAFDLELLEDKRNYRR
jgi:Arc/MetJ family transcription regulator